jgi:hypothetical protein
VGFRAWGIGFTGYSVLRSGVHAFKALKHSRSSRRSRRLV